MGVPRLRGAQVSRELMHKRITNAIGNKLGVALEEAAGQIAQIPEGSQLANNLRMPDVDASP